MLGWPVGYMSWCFVLDECLFFEGYIIVQCFERTNEMSMFCMCPFVCFPANHLTDKDAKAFAEALKENRTLAHLDLSYNQIGEMGGIYLGAGLVSNV